MDWDQSPPFNLVYLANETFLAFENAIFRFALVKLVRVLDDGLVRVFLEGEVFDVRPIQPPAPEVSAPALAEEVLSTPPDRPSEPRRVPVHQDECILIEVVPR